MPEVQPVVCSKRIVGRADRTVKDADTLTAEMVDAFIDEMILYNNGHVEVKFNFRNELDEVIHLAAIRQREVERYAM